VTLSRSFALWLVPIALLGGACGSAPDMPSGAAEAVGTASADLSTGTMVSLQINSGGPAVMPFAADEDFSGGNTTKTTSTIDRSAVTNPAPMAVYQDSRLGVTTYTVSGFVPNSAGTVRLHFAEIYFGKAGARQFNVAINGTPVLTSFDIFKTAGAKNKANVQQFPAFADWSGTYQVALTAVKDNPLIAGVEIIGPSPCVKGPAAQYFYNVYAAGMVGCPGAVTWANRNSLCSAGYHAASANEWQMLSGVLTPPTPPATFIPPLHDYWTNDNLGYTGSGTSSCAAVDPLNEQGNADYGNPCPANQPMRVCTSSGTDAEGNQCNWTNCGFGASALNTYFGGCFGNATAGTLCIPNATTVGGTFGELGSTGPESTGYITGLSGVCLDLPADSVFAGVGVDIRACNQKSSQSWAMTPNGQIVGPGNQCLSVTTLGQSGAAVQIEPCSALPVPAGQYWDWLSNGTIANVNNSGLCLTIPGGNTADGTAVQVASCTGATSQQWTIHGAAQLQGAGSLCADILNSVTTDGTMVQGATCNGDVNQKWTVTPSGMVRGLKGVCLDLPTGSTKLDVRACNGSKNQKWSFSAPGAPNPSHLVSAATNNCVQTTPGQLTAAANSCSSGQVDWTFATPLTVGLRPQQQTGWCWAATGEMMMSYFGKDLPQCVQANHAFGRTDCCINPTSEASTTLCNQGGNPDFTFYGFSTTSTPGAMPFASLTAQVQTAPIAFVWDWAGGDSHEMVAFGTSTVTDTSTNTTTQYVLVDDPSMPFMGDQFYITYPAWVSSFHNYTHELDLSNFKRTSWPQYTTPVGTPAGYVKSDNATAVMYANPSNDPVELCIGGSCGTTWQRTDLTTTYGAPTTGSGWLSPYVRNDGGNAVTWIDYAGHVQEASYVPGSGSWTLIDLTVASGAQVTAQFGAAVGYPKSDIFGAVTYEGSDSHIHELERRVYQTAWYWTDVDVSGPIGAPNGNWPIGYVRPDGLNVIVYHGDNDVYELAWDASTWTWTYGDLSAAVGAPAISTFDPVHPYARADGAAAVYYRDVSNHLQEISLTGGVWHLLDLTCSAAPGAQTPPIPYRRADNVDAVLYEGSVDGHLYEIERTGTGSCPWVYKDLTAATGSTLLPAAGWFNFATGLVRGDGVTSVLFLTSDSHVHEMTLQGTWQLDANGADDLTPGGP
jgi:hypothetical protein